MKKIVSLVGALIIGATVLIYLGTLPTLDEDEYIGITEYEPIEELQKDTFSVVTYNIGYLSGMTNNLPIDSEVSFYQNNLQRSIELIQSYQPDVIGFQEIDFASQRSFYQNQMDSIALACNYPFGTWAVNWDKNFVPFPFWPPSSFFGEMLSGQAILTKGRILDVQRVVLNKPEGQNFVYNAYYIDRLVQVVKIKLSGREVVVLNVHLEAFFQETREEQAKIVRTIYESYAKEYPVLLVGDFNAEIDGSKGENDGTMDILLEGADIAHAFVRSELKTDPKAHYTFSSAKPAYKIDYILYNPSRINKIDYKVLREASDISDHLPVWMKFTFVNS